MEDSAWHLYHLVQQSRKLKALGWIQQGFADSPPQWFSGSVLSLSLSLCLFFSLFLDKTLLGRSWSDEGRHIESHHMKTRVEKRPRDSNPFRPGTGTTDVFLRFPSSPVFGLDPRESPNPSFTTYIPNPNSRVRPQTLTQHLVSNLPATCDSKHSFTKATPNPTCRAPSPKSRVRPQPKTTCSLWGPKSTGLHKLDPWSSF